METIHDEVKKLLGFIHPGYRRKLLDLIGQLMEHIEVGGDQLDELEVRVE